MLLWSAGNARATVISDNFNDGDFTSNPSWTAYNGSWSVTSGVVNQTATGGPYTTGPHRLLMLDSFSSDGPYTIEADMRIDGDAGNDSVGLAFHVQDADNFYAFVFFPGFSGGSLRFIEVTSGTAAWSASINITGTGTPSLSVFHHMEVVVNGSNFTLTVSGPKDLSPFTYTYTNNFNDSSFTGGGVALFSQISPGFFDNFVLTVVPEPASLALLAVGGALLLPRRR